MIDATTHRQRTLLRHPAELPRDEPDHARRVAGAFRLEVGVLAEGQREGVQHEEAHLGVYICVSGGGGVCVGWWCGVCVIGG